MPIQENKGVLATHPQYDEFLPVWTKCEDAAEGERKVHKAGELYLPKLKFEKDEDYKSRRDRTPFFNATWRTISGLKGMMFSKPPVIDVPASIVPYMTDIDMEGRPVDLFAQHCSEELLKVGRIGLLVDNPPMPVNQDGSSITVAQAEALGIRPSIKSYLAKHITNWKWSRVNNRMQLTLAVLKESASVGADEFDQTTEDRYRVLDLVVGVSGERVYRQRVYRINAKGEQEQVDKDIYPMMNGRAMSYIPFVIIGVDDISPDVDSPPLLDLIDMNFHHYAVSADYEHGCHFSGLPTGFLFGYQAEDDSKPIYIGGPAFNCIPNDQAHAEYLQINGGFDGLLNNLKEKKAEMAVLGARMLEGQNNAVESDDTLRQKSFGEQSQLAAMANVLSMGMTKALTIFAEWAGASGAVSYQINTDYVPAGLSSEDLTALVTSWQSGAISKQTLFMNLKKGEIVESSVTYEEEQERINSEGPKV